MNVRRRRGRGTPVTVGMAGRRVGVRQGVGVGRRLLRHHLHPVRVQLGDGRHQILNRLRAHFVQFA